MSAPRRPLRRTRLPLLAGLLVAATATAGLTGCTDDRGFTAVGEPTAASETSTSSGDEWLFTVSAPSATLTRAGDGAEVTLSSPGHVLMFTDRPARKAHRLRAGWLASDWEQLFRGDPPNAVLTGVTEDGAAVDAAVEVRSLTGDDTALVARVVGVGEDAGARLPARLQQVQLFIDDASTDMTWEFHPLIPDAAQSKYVATATINSGDTSNSFIYSMPATALVSSFTDHHLQTSEIQGGITFDGYRTMPG